jgi:hypothetical protein
MTTTIITNIITDTPTATQVTLTSLEVFSGALSVEVAMTPVDSVGFVTV